MRRTPEKINCLQIQVRLGGPITALSAEECRLNIKEARRGDSGAFLILFKYFLPLICQKLQEYDHKGSELLDLINKVEECLRQNLDHFSGPVVEDPGEIENAARQVIAKCIDGAGEK